MNSELGVGRAKIGKEKKNREFNEDPSLNLGTTGAKRGEGRFEVKRKSITKRSGRLLRNINPQTARKE